MEKYNFSGYATKNNLKCSDGRTIRKDAFKANDGERVPLVWQHGHKEPSNVLGHAVLENREDGVYAYGMFNSTEAGKTAATLVEHGDIKALSIYANSLVQKGSDVIHGVIREVSLVLSGANPGALIDNLVVVHADGSDTEVEDEAVIYTGLEISLKEQIKHEDPKPNEGGETVGEIFESMSDKQKNVVYAMIAEVLDAGGDMEQSGVKMEEENLEHSNDGGNKLMKKNVFDSNGEPVEAIHLTPEQFQAIVTDAQKSGSFREAFLAHAGTYGIDNIGVLFPDAKAVTSEPDMIMREMAWVASVLGGTRHSPFSRIKSATADITVESARALGYVTGALKKEEVFALLSRTTTPTTIYKKQKLDRDDIVDITDLNVVSWLKAEMRIMLNEELARAILISDGRDVSSEDKIPEDKIRPIYKDADMYVHRVRVLSDAEVEDIIDDIIRAREFYKGSGSPTLFVTTSFLTDMLLLKDTLGHRIYRTEQELAAALRVSSIVEVPLMTGVEREVTEPAPATLLLKAIIVNLKDYTLGADKGGEINMFDDFDIDYNQYKYLLETRVSGALVKPKSAIILEQEEAAG